MGLRMAGTAVAAALAIGALLVFTAPGAAVGAPVSKAPLLVVTERKALPVQASIGPGSIGTSDVSCSPGEQVVGGGFHWGTYDPALDDFSLLIGQDGSVVRSSSYGTAAWRVSVLNTSASASIDLRATVLCAKIQ
jgi:hypothetical protein